MNLSEVSLLLGIATTYDGRIQLDEFKVRAWHESLDEDLAFPDGRLCLYQHYANTEVMVNPSHINKIWRIKVNNLREKEQSKKISLEFEMAREKAASPKSVEIYMAQIRESLNRSSNANLEENNGEVASDS
jgi:hypothetical protein